MSLATSLGLAVALAMDATAVAATRGLAGQKAGGLREPAVVAVTFGVFQGGLAFVGSLLEGSIGPSIEAVDHWIAFVILGALGVKMIVDAIRGGDDEVKPLGPAMLLALGVGTSIDALAAGFTLRTLDVSVPFTLVAIGVVTFLLSFVGYFVGRMFGARLGKGLAWAGGLALVALGVKVLWDHGALG